MNEQMAIMTREVEIVGEVKSSGGIQIDGKLDGNLNCQKAIVGQGGRIKGNISADSVTISGRVDGNISAKDKISMKSTAHVMGDIKSKRLSVEEGVTFVGGSEVNPGAGKGQG